MSHRPRIGITVHSADVRAREGNRETRFEVSARYALAVARAGGLPLLLPVHPSVEVTAAETLAGLDGLLLSGGGGLSADYFVEHPNPTLRDTNPARYDVEVDLIKAAWAAGMPLLGICRGHQTMVEALGGSLVNDLSADPMNAEHYQTLPATQPTHALALRPDSLLARLMPDGVMVNSFHRQAVTSVPPGWRVMAWSPDGVVEAVESHTTVPSDATGAAPTAAADHTPSATPSGSRFAVGCQFHPEWLGESEPGFERLFVEFVEAAGAFAAGPRATGAGATSASETTGAGATSASETTGAGATSTARATT